MTIVAKINEIDKDRTAEVENCSKGKAVVLQSLSPQSYIETGRDRLPTPQFTDNMTSNVFPCPLTITFFFYC